MLSAGIAMLIAACAVAPHDVAPAKAPAADLDSMNCGDLRYALDKAQRELDASSRAPALAGAQGEIERLGQVLKDNPWMVPLVPFAAIGWVGAFHPLLAPLALATETANQVDAQTLAIQDLARARGNVAAFTEAMRAKECAPRAPSSAREFLRFDCTMWTRSWVSATNVPAALPTRLVIKENGFEYLDRIFEPTVAYTEIDGAWIDGSRSTPPDSTGRFTIVERSGRTDTFEIRAQDCSPATSEEVARARAIIGDWLQSLMR
jgi:hypothetical protein